MASEIVHHAIPPRDARGVEIREGDTVVTALSHGRLYEREVTRIDSSGEPRWWVTIWCGGYSTTPDRVAVIEPGNRS